MLIGIFYSQIVESSFLVFVLFREAISHPSFYSLTSKLFFYYQRVRGSTLYVGLARAVSPINTNSG